MYSERAKRYMRAMEATYGPDYLHERYATEDPADYDPMTGRPEGRLPFTEWVEQQAAEWAFAQDRSDPVRPRGYDVVSYRLAKLRHLRDRQRVNFDEDRAIEIDELSRALGEEESA